MIPMAPDAGLIASCEEIASPVVSISGQFRNMIGKIVNKIYENFYKFIIPKEEDRQITFIVSVEAIDLREAAEGIEAEIAPRIIQIARDFFSNASSVSFKEDAFTDEEVATNPTIVPQIWAIRFAMQAHFFCTDQLVERVIDLPKERQDQSCYQYAFHEMGYMIGSFQPAELPEILTEELMASQIDSPIEGDLVVYFNGGGSTHAGIVRKDGLIESKWGDSNPKAYLHRLDDVPESYGRDIRYYRAPIASKSEI